MKPMMSLMFTLEKCLVERVGVLSSKTLSSKALSSKEHWSNGTLVEWNIGRTEHWSNEHSSNGTFV